MTTYLITGGSGFIGSHLTEQLLSLGNKVINIDNFDDFYDYRIKIRNTLDSIKSEKTYSPTGDKYSDLASLSNIVNYENYKLYISDIRHLDELRRIFEGNKVDVIIHLAAKAGVRPSIDNPISYAETNYIGSINILEAAKEFGIKKIIMASSSSVYGNNTKVPFSEEDKLCSIISQYAATKHAMETISKVYSHLYNINIVILRFFTVYGPRQRPDLAIHKFTRLIHSNLDIPFYGDGTTSRDYTYIDDIIDGIMSSIKYLMNNDSVYEIINLGHSSPISLSKLISLIEEACGKKAKLKLLANQPGDVTTTYADISKAKKLLGYMPKYPLKKGLEIFIKWFSDNKEVR